MNGNYTTAAGYLNRNLIQGAELILAGNFDGSQSGKFYVGSTNDVHMKVTGTLRTGEAHINQTDPYAMTDSSVTVDGGAWYSEGRQIGVGMSGNGELTIIKGGTVEAKEVQVDAAARTS